MKESEDEELKSFINTEKKQQGSNRAASPQSKFSQGVNRA